MRKLTSNFNNNNCINNIAVLLGEQELNELPYWETINNYLKLFDTTELETVITKIVSRLIRMQTFYNSRIRGKYWQILIDGTELYNFGALDEPHCAQCLKKEHKDKQGNIVWTEYYHSVLEAKLVINGDIVLSIATEFIENEQPNATKQDCERNAFKRLSKKLKQRFPRLPVCLCMDSLYACAPVFDLCKENKWHYIIRFKDGSIKTVATEFHALKTMETSQIFVRTEPDTGIIKTYSYVLGIPYQTHNLNIIEYIQDNLPYPYVFITDLPISKRNYEQTVNDGRRRWKIENEGFNAQKNQGYGLEHMFCEDYTAMKNHYLCIQIGHMIFQIFVHAVDIWQELKQPLYAILEHLVQSFKSIRLINEDNQDLKGRLRVRFRFT
jgi:hypothetical protein